MNKRINTAEAAKYLGFSEIALRNARMTERLGHREAPPYFKIGKKVFYDLDDLDTYIQSCRIVPEPVAAVAV